MPKNKVNVKVISNVVGTLLFINGLLMLLCLPFSIYYKESVWPFIISSIITITVGFGLKYWSRKSGEAEIRKRDGYLIVVLGWLSMTAFGTLPYGLSGAIPNFTDAFFETMSGFSTTGASVLDNIEGLPNGILFWRSMTQWIGGMGIIVLTIAILPLLGIAGMELFVAEAPGPTKDKIHPRIKETAKRLWVIYVILTAAETIALMLCGMNFFDAINHSLTTCSTGGFSTKQASIAHFNSSAIEYVIVFFMFFSGTNFTLLYFAFKGRIRKIWQNDEFKWYLGFVLTLIAVVTVGIYFYSDAPPGNPLRFAIFQVVSIVTTTGYASADFTTWGAFVSFIFFLLLFTGASAGSTSGGIKLVRVVLLVKNGFMEFKRKLHPNAIIPIQLNNTSVSDKIIYNLMAFIVLYLMVFTLGSAIMSSMGVEFLTAVSSVATSLSNVGPGLSEIGPSETFTAIPAAGKWVLSFLMLCGRLELFTVLLLFTPFFWRNN